MVAVTSTTLRDYLPLVATGKVREIYELDDHKLLFVTTDRISGKSFSHRTKAMTDLRRSLRRHHGELDRSERSHLGPLERILVQVYAKENSFSADALPILGHPIGRQTTLAL